MARVDTIEYLAIDTLGNATDFGDLNGTTTYCGSCSNGTRGLFMGGSVAGGSNLDVIDYITIASLGNASDFGNLTLARNDTKALSDGPYWTPTVKSPKSAALPSEAKVQ